MRVAVFTPANLFGEHITIFNFNAKINSVCVRKTCVRLCCYSKKTKLTLSKVRSYVRTLSMRDIANGYSWLA